jgi:signal transduction histidine kinase
MAATTPGRTILVVEDEPHILQIVSLLLGDEGHHVLQAGGGLEALSIVGRQKPDLIISDVKMPGMDGYALCERVRANPELTQVPFIFLTAKSDRADVRRGMELGADDYLIKPFEPEELLAAVNVRLARAAEAQAAIHQAGADLQDKIIRTLTHEFRTPLALVVGYTELLETSGLGMGNEEFGQVMQGLHNGSRRLMSLVEDFLLLSKLQTGAIQNEIMRARENPLMLDAVVRLTVKQAEELAATREVTLTTDCQSGNLSLDMAKQHLVEIVRRLLDNAIKFSRQEGGAVHVSTRVEGQRWILRISDQGIGIRQEAQEWIFEAFRQVDRGQMEQQGSGVGLTIVRGLVEAYGGSIGLESTVGEGSTFSVRLPIPDGSQAY